MIEYLKNIFALLFGFGGRGKAFGYGFKILFWEFIFNACVILIISLVFMIIHKKRCKEIDGYKITFDKDFYKDQLFGYISMALVFLTPILFVVDLVAYLFKETEILSAIIGYVGTVLDIGLYILCISELRDKTKKGDNDLIRDSVTSEDKLLNVEYRNILKLSFKELIKKVKSVRLFYVKFIEDLDEVIKSDESNINDACENFNDLDKFKKDVNYLIDKFIEKRDYCLGISDQLMREDINIEGLDKEVAFKSGKIAKDFYEYSEDNFSYCINELRKKVGSLEILPDDNETRDIFNELKNIFTDSIGLYFNKKAVDMFLLNVIDKDKYPNTLAKYEKDKRYFINDESCINEIIERLYSVPKDFDYENQLNEGSQAGRYFAAYTNEEKEKIKSEKLDLYDIQDYMVLYSLTESITSYLNAYDEIVERYIKDRGMTTAGESSENLLEDTLSIYDDEVKYFRNVRFEDKISVENDYLIIGKNGIYSVEVKNYSGKIKINKSGQWYRKKYDADEYSLCSSVDSQSDRHIVVTERILKKAVKDAKLDINIKVIPVIVIANNNAIIENESDSIVIVPDKLISVLNKETNIEYDDKTIKKLATIINKNSKPLNKYKHVDFVASVEGLLDYFIEDGDGVLSYYLSTYDYNLLLEDFAAVVKKEKVKNK